jgi:hypothetical protein
MWRDLCGYTACLTPSHLIPDLEAGLERGTVFPGAHTVTSWLKMARDGARSAERKRWACLADLNFRMFFSRSRVGWCEFSARLFNLLCCRCSPPGKMSRLAAPYLTSKQGQVMLQQHNIDDQWLAECSATQGIIIPLDLGELTMVSQSLQADGSIEVHVKAKTDRAVCPTGKKICVKVHDSRLQVKRDIQLRDHQVYLVLAKRRFRCLACRHTFTEPDTVCGSAYARPRPHTKLPSNPGI